MKKRLFALLMCIMLVVPSLQVWADNEPVLNQTDVREMKESSVPRDNKDEASLELTSDNFPDTNFLNYIKNNIDTNGDGRLIESEIAAVTSINCSSKSISSLEGIQYFTGLTSLICNLNKLTELDLSRNIALTKLNCSNNQLTELDLSRNIALAYLNCRDNRLTRLDVSKNLALTELNCSYNQLTELDLSRNTALVSLKCYENRLIKLDVSKNPALTTLGCSSNQLTE